MKRQATSTPVLSTSSQRNSAPLAASPSTPKFEPSSDIRKRRRDEENKADESSIADIPPLKRRKIGAESCGSNHKKPLELKSSPPPMPVAGLPLAASCNPFSLSNVEQYQSFPLFLKICLNSFHIKELDLSLRLNSRIEIRKKSYKIRVDADEARRRRKANLVDIKNHRRENNLLKKRCERLLGIEKQIGEHKSEFHQKKERIKITKSMVGMENSRTSGATQEAHISTRLIESDMPHLQPISDSSPSMVTQKILFAKSGEYVSLSIVKSSSSKILNEIPFTNSRLITYNIKNSGKIIRIDSRILDSCSVNKNKVQWNDSDDSLHIHHEKSENKRNWVDVDDSVDMTNEMSESIVEDNTSSSWNCVYGTNLALMAIQTSHTFAETQQSHAGSKCKKSDHGLTLIKQTDNKLHTDEIPHNYERKQPETTISLKLNSEERLAKRRRVLIAIMKQPVTVTSISALMTGTVLFEALANCDHMKVAIVGGFPFDPGIEWNSQQSQWRRLWQIQLFDLKDIGSIKACLRTGNLKFAVLIKNNTQHMKIADSRLQFLFLYYDCLCKTPYVGVLCANKARL